MARADAFAAQVAAEVAGAVRARTGHQEPGRQDQGPRLGVSRRLRTWLRLGIRINSISDVTPVPHNGCRPQKRRRI